MGEVFVPGVGSEGDDEDEDGLGVVGFVGFGGGRVEMGGSGLCRRAFFFA